MVLVCRRGGAVWEKVGGEDRGRMFKINLYRRGSASIAGAICGETCQWAGNCSNIPDPGAGGLPTAHRLRVAIRTLLARLFSYMSLGLGACCWAKKVSQIEWPSSAEHRFLCAWAVFRKLSAANSPVIARAKERYTERPKVDCEADREPGQN